MLTFKDPIEISDQVGTLCAQSTLAANLNISHQNTEAISV